MADPAYAWREPILAALFTLVATSADYKTTGRRVILWNQVTMFPALFVQLTKTEYPPRDARGLPAKRTLDAEAWIYTNGGTNPHVTPETALNNAIDSVEAILKPPFTGGFITLGGRVHHCWIEGTAEQYNGVLDGIAKAIIPIRMLVP